MSRDSICTRCLQRGHTASSCKLPIIRMFLASLALMFIVACGGGGGGSGGFVTPAVLPTVVQPAPKECSVDLYGDSIMAGNGTAETPAMTLKRLRPELAVTDKAAPGTSLAMLDQFFRNDPRSARFVVIENGTIDSWSGGDPEGFSALLGGLIDYVRAEGRVAVLTGLAQLTMPPSIAGRAQYDAAIRRLAAEKGVAFADWGAVQFDGAGDVPDAVHPAKAYSDRLVERLAAAIPPC